MNAPRPPNSPIIPYCVDEGTADKPKRQCARCGGHRTIAGVGIRVDVVHVTDVEVVCEATRVGIGETGGICKVLHTKTPQSGTERLDERYHGRDVEHVPAISLYSVVRVANTRRYDTVKDGPLDNAGMVRAKRPRVSACSHAPVYVPRASDHRDDVVSEGGDSGGGCATVLLHRVLIPISIK